MLAIRVLGDIAGQALVIVGLVAVGIFFYLGGQEDSDRQGAAGGLQLSMPEVPAQPEVGAGATAPQPAVLPLPLGARRADGSFFAGLGANPQEPGLFGYPPPTQTAPQTARPYTPPVFAAHAGAAPSAPPAPLGASALPTPLEQGAAHKQLVEGHWLGMELLDLTPTLAAQYQLPPGQHGLLVDEVSLEAAEAGLLAGDVVASIGGMRVANLGDFRDATWVVRARPQVDIGLWRKGQPRTVVLRAGLGALGFAMFEAASPIKPGAISPHKSRGRPCTECHIIMDNGGQLPIDAGDILPTPPPIAPGAVPTHGNRGPCQTCHTVVTQPAATRAKRSPW